MAEKVYLDGLQANNGTLFLPFISSAVLFVSKYCQAHHFKFMIVSLTDTTKQDKYVEVPCKMVTELNIEYIEESKLPVLVKNCMLPVTVNKVTSMIRSGLCGTVRHIIQSTHQKNPGESYIDLLGFRNGSLRMCAEVSGWTKLCEVELPATLHQLLKDIREIENKENHELEIPVDLVKLEKNFYKPPKLHNDHKIKKQVLVQNRDDILNLQTGRQLLESLKRGSEYLYERDVPLTHGIRRYQIYKNVNNNLYLKSDKKYTREKAPKYKFKDREREITVPVKKSQEERAEVRKEKKKRKFARREARRLAELAEETEKLNLNQNGSNNCDIEAEKGYSELEDFDGNLKPLRQEPYSIEEIVDSFKMLSVLDVHFVHVYSEGLEMTVADLILFVYLYFVMEGLNFQIELLKDKLPNINKWLNHMLSLHTISITCQSCGLSWTSLSDRTSNIRFILPNQNVTMVEDMELHQRNKSNIRAIKPEVTEILDLIQKSKINIDIGNHPCNNDVSIDWSDLPISAHPQEGAVPRKRIERKCQQLENLVTAVTKLSNPNDIIVDFCSGGGHLGIVIAYLLPNCKIYLVENKEESIERARARVENLHLTNVVIYQCNLDYFHGMFNIGVCLHACGVATDMVLQQCLNKKAAFVICPCCYGSIVKTHKISYPRSQLFQNSGISYKDFVTLGHAADQTEFKCALADQGVYCANIVDTDRAELARQNNYTVNLCSLQPKSCTPKNNLLIGIPNV